MSSRQKDYQRYGNQICTFMRACEMNMGGSLQDDIQILIEATGLVDEWLDNTRQRSLREKYRVEVLRVIKGNDPSEVIPSDVQAAIKTFAERMRSRNQIDSTLQIISDMFALQEEMRATKEPMRYADLSLEEGRGSAKLVLAVVDEEANDSFTKVANALGPTANLFDDMYDAKRDFANKEISINPSIQFYIVCIRKLLPEILKTFAVYPSKTNGIVIFMKGLLRAWRTRNYG